MDLSLGNIYSIPENPSEEEPNNSHYCETSFSACKKVNKRISSVSLHEIKDSLQNTDLKKRYNSTPTFLTTEEKDRNFKTVLGSKATTQKHFDRLSVSLLDFSSISITGNSKTVNVDKQNALSNGRLSHMISKKISKSYLNIQDCTSYSNHERQYEALLSSYVISNVNSDQNLNSVTPNTCQSKQKKESGNIVFIDLNSEEDGYQNIEYPAAPNASRQRARSLQWIQNAFQNVSNKYKDILEFRRPSDIVEERMRKSNEGLDMEESESEATTDVNQNPSTGTRRFSEHITGKQKRFPFVGRLGHLKGLWKDRHPHSKRQEEKENDQTRADVCPLFTFPRKRDEDELILDTLRQAMRKCTVVDPTSRPTSTIVFENLSNLLKEF